MSRKLVRYIHRGITAVSLICLLIGIILEHISAIYAGAGLLALSISLPMAIYMAEYVSATREGE